MRIKVVGGVALTAIMLTVGCGDSGDADEELTPEGRHFCEAWEAGAQDANEEWAKRCYRAGYYNPNYAEYFDN